MLKMISAIDTFAALADPIRLRCLALIAARQELCVCERVGALELPQPKVSRHLAI
jgi:ArsR family transcriptional regulator